MNQEYEEREYDEQELADREIGCPHYHIYENGETNMVACSDCGEIFNEGKIPE